MQIAVVSDTHGHLEFTREATRILDELKIEAVIHCGDIGSISVVSLFGNWPTHFVFGNVDTHNMSQLQAAIESAGQTCHGRFGQLTLAEQRIAFLHSDDHRLFQQTIASGEWDLVCYGHTHVTESHFVNQTLVMNPGALYRASPRSFALVDLPSREITTITL
ncbi:MAG: MJ0936 family phosphodiesterase [Planctomycetaceae bacterium]